MDSLQPKTVPFPFTRMEDYEASLSQPLGKEWNSLSSHSNLIKPTVSTQVSFRIVFFRLSFIKLLNLSLFEGGRVILPMSKNDVLKTRLDKPQDK